jgi:putative transposase
MDEFFSEASRTLLTSLFSSAMIDVRMLVWTLVVGFAVGGEARSTDGYRRAYEAATDQSIFPSSFYDRFTEELARFLRDLLNHAVEEVAVLRTLALTQPQSYVSASCVTSNRWL